MKIIPASRSVTVQIKFERQVSHLLNDWNSVQTAFESLSQKQLLFAQNLKELWDQAKVIDKNSRGDVHQNYIRKQLSEIIKSDNKSILSRWVTIGTNATALLPYANSLPSQRDALYVAAKAIEENKPIAKWISKGQITPDTTVREVMSLRGGNISIRKRVKRTDQELVTVEIKFSGSYGDVAKTLGPLIDYPTVIHVKSHKALADSFKALLGKDDYEKIASKFK
jgi:hypothetical protein